MIHVVTAAERVRYAAALREMYCDRRRVFVDRLGWTIPVTKEGLEIDQFDTTAAVYLLALDAAGRCQGSLRLLPTNGPHILGELFPQLCDGEVPRGESVLEISRFCTCPDLPDPRLVRKQLLVALVEYALLNEVGRFTCVTHADALTQLLAIGWDCTPLGLPQPDGGAVIGALEIRITAETLSLLRDRAGFRAPVLRWEAAHAA